MFFVVFFVFFKCTIVRFVPKDGIICSKYTCGSFHISKIAPSPLACTDATA